MSNDINKIIKKYESAEKLLKKIDLLNRKKDLMGLFPEEEQELLQLTKSYEVESLNLVGTVVETFIEQFYDEDTFELLEKIKTKFSWNGRMVCTDEEVKTIINAKKQISKAEFKELKQNLNDLYQNIIDTFDEILEDDVIYESFEALSLVITNGDMDSDIRDTIYYVTDIYKEFGLIIGVKLPEIELEEYE